MDSSVSVKDEIWFLCMCHHISNAVYLLMMGLDKPETCRGWQNILRISCVSSWFSFTQLCSMFKNYKDVKMVKSCWKSNHFNYLTEKQVSAVGLQKPAAMQNITAHTNVCCVSYQNKIRTCIHDPLHNLQLPEKYVYRAHLTLCTVMRGASVKVSDARGANLRYNLSHLVHCSLSFSLPWGTAW
jgi:hypothetical protein